MQRRSRILQDRSGMALVMAILVLFICSAVLLGLVNYTVSEYRATHLDERQVQALYCAEAGVDYALDVIRRVEALPGGSVSLGDLGLEDAEGDFVISSQPPGNDADAAKDPQATYRVTSTGYLPSKEEYDKGNGVKRTVVAIVGRGVWDFGLDAVRSKKGITYGANDALTVVCNNLYQPVAGSGVNASIRVTGYAGNESIAGTGQSNASIHGNASAPGQVRVGDAWSISQGAENYMPDAFPSDEEIGFDGGGHLVWPPAPGTMIGQYLQDAQAGGTLTSADITSPMTIEGSKYIDLGGGNLTGTITFRGPGTVVVNGSFYTGGNLKVYNGPDPVTLVVTGNFRSSAQNDEYHGDPGSAGTCPPLIVLGTEVSDRGQGTWHINGPLMALNPNVTVEVWSSAVGITGNSASNDSYDLSGAIISNGTVAYNGAHSVLAFPEALSGQRFTVATPAVVKAYSAALNLDETTGQMVWEKVGRPVGSTP